MVIHQFPPLELADENGLLAIGGDLEVDSLILAYTNGIFPWPVRSDLPIPWFSPPQRSILFFSEMHVSHSLKKQMKRGDFLFTVDQDFPNVITACAEYAHRPGQSGTWITPEIIAAYTALHRAGLAHSVECWNRDGSLVGGIYGVSIGCMFAGESMFFREPNASKCCLVKLVELLQSRGGTWLDCQVENHLSRAFGARDIPRHEFVKLLNKSTLSTPIFPELSITSATVTLCDSRR